MQCGRMTPSVGLDRADLPLVGMPGAVAAAERLLLVGLVCPAKQLTTCILCLGDARAQQQLVVLDPCAHTASR